MRLHLLTVEAFGPFVAEQRIDFDDVTSGGLFLVHGPTGAGKTSVLDAVCFALFADVPGDRQTRGLVSDFAPPGRPARVLLEFTAGGRRLRIDRSSEFQPPKKRGSGTTGASARVTLEERVAGRWQVASTRIDETADIVQDVVGVGLDQFRRVALLPQGDFAAFLTASPEARRALLEKLFDVTRFTGVEAWLAQRRRDLRATVEGSRRDLGHLVTRLTDLMAIAGPELGADSEPGLADVPVTRWPDVAAGLSAGAATWAAAALARQEAASSAETQAGAAHAAAVRLAHLRTRGRRAQDVLARASAQRAEIEGARTRHTAATRASAARGELLQYAAAASARAAAADRWVAALAEGRRLGLIGADGEHAAGRLMLDALRRQSASLDQIQSRVRSAAELADLSAVAGRAAEDAGAALARAERELTSASRKVTEVEATLADLAPVVAELPRRTARRDAAVRLLGLRVEIDLLTGQIEVAEAKLVGAREAHADARDVLLGLREARLDDFAAELAATLADGSPCPVCGSVEHPVRHTVGSAEWSPEAITAAERAVERAAESVADRRSAVADLTGRLAARTADLVETATSGSTATDLELPTPITIDGGSAGLCLAALTDGILRAAVDRASRQADDAVAAAAAATGARVELDRHRARALALAEALTQARTVEATTRTRAADLAARWSTTLAQAARLVDEHANCCPCSVAAEPRPGSSDGPGSCDGLSALGAAVTEAGERHTLALDVLTEMIQAEQALGVADRGASEALVALDEAVSAAEFPDREALANALLPVAELQALARKIADHDHASAAHTATLADPEVAAALALTDAPDPAAVERAHHAAKAALSTATRDAATAGRTATEVAGVATAITALATRLAPEERLLAEVTELADVVAGTSPNNTMKMRLSSFVLAARLERVVDLANERLRVMGEGRFQLRHDDGRAGRGARSGLGILAHDEWTGTTRTPASLSGGESFMTSLALALGLADAVRESAGGFEMETLFVDEGFGSLDGESLEQVLAVLDDLRDGGRAVGVISHVADLRERISHRIEVRKSPTGSTVTAVA